MIGMVIRHLRAYTLVLAMTAVACGAEELSPPDTDVGARASAAQALLAERSSEMRNAPPVHLPVPAPTNADAIPAVVAVEGGTATATIAIDVPPGRRGMQPDISLVYSSRAGPGSVGVGWALRATSAIHRCPRTVAQDGQTRAVDYAGLDRLCLDGQRLMLVRGAYGARDSEYRTELDTFARITLINGDIDTKESYFRVEHKSGQWALYGGFRGHNAVHTPPGALAPLAWKLAYRIDRQWNTVRYRYGTAAAGHVLREIRYTGQRWAPGDRRVRFVYERAERDAPHGYRHGAREMMPRRLIEIRTFTDEDTLVRRYVLAYQASAATGRALLERITICADQACRAPDTTPATEFLYTQEALDFAEEAIAEADAADQEARLLGDYDGDGRRDLLVLTFEEHGGNPAQRLLYLSSRLRPIDLSRASWLRVFDREADAFPGDRDTDFDHDGVSDLIGEIDGYFAIASWNGERLVPVRSNLFLPRTTAVAQILDADADGESDVLVLDRGDMHLYRNCTSRPGGPMQFCAAVPVTTLAPAEQLVRAADVDGNGLPDLVIDWNGAGERVPARVVLTRSVRAGVAFYSRPLAALGGPAGALRAEAGTSVLDVNADGLVDIFRLPDQLWLGTGRGFVRADDLRGTVRLDAQLYDAALPMDVDADGREELLVPAALVHDWCYTENPRTEPIEYCGAGFLHGNAPAHLDRSLYRWDAVGVRFDAGGRPRLARVATSIVAPLRVSHIDDFHGDGLPDVRYRIADMYGEGPVGTVLQGHYRPPLPKGTYLARNRGTGGTGDAPDLLARVRDGLGREHAFAYAPLSRAGVRGCRASASRPFYRAYREAAAPHHYHVTSSMRVVARWEEPSGTGTPHATCYRYQDAMQSDEGRGFQGFRAIFAEQAFAEDPEDNLRTTTWYHDAFPLTGRVRRVYVTRVGDAAATAPIHETLTTWRARCDGGICVPYIVEQVERTRDLATRALLHTTTTRTSYDDGDLRYGNPSAIEVVTDDGFRTSTARVALHYDYADLDAWWIDKLVRQTVTHEPVVYQQAPYPDDTDNLRKQQDVTFAWFDETDPARRLLARQELQPGDDTQAQRIEHTYDLYGNPVRRRITAARLETAQITHWRYTADGYFRHQEDNAVGHRYTAVHDAATGALLSEETYGVETTFAYDRLGRLLTRHRAGEPPVHVRRLWCDASCPPAAVLRVVTVQDGAPIETQDIDARGRVIRRAQTAFGGGADIVQVARYDARGRLVAQSPPSHERGGAHFTEYGDHDALGRPGYMTQDRSGHAHGRVTTRYRYAGATTHIERPGGRTEARTHDARGQLVWSEDAAGHRTHYRYDGQDNLILLERAGHRTQAQYDDRGRRIRLIDPDSGRRLFAWDGLDQLVAETDANGTATRYAYDGIGRLRERRRDGRRVAHWRYDGVRPGTLAGEYGEDGFEREYLYDAFLRPTRITTRMAGLRFEQQYDYDAYYGRPTAMRFPHGETVAFDYDDYGYPTTARNAARPAELYRRIEQVTARGQIAREHFGNGLVSTYDHMPSTGAVLRIQVAAAGHGGDAVQDLAYAYDDPYGNLTRREDRRAGVAERLTYDALQRIDQVTRTWARGRVPLAIVYAYDALGNLTRKDDFAHHYDYGDAARDNGANAGPHAVRAVTLPDGRTLDDFAYDASGNMVAGNGRVIQYNERGQPTEIIETDGTTTRFAYAPDGSRYQQAQGDKTVFYVGSDFEYVLHAEGTPEVTVEQRAFIGDYLVIEHEDGARRLRYLHPDRQGSLATITDEAGAVIERHAYDAFGTPLTSQWRDADGRLHNGEYTAETTTRGFTGHEHLDAHRLIHMGGRAYDPRLGRFLSVDPFIQDLANSQSLNPYSYVFNNPFSGTDPTGLGCMPIHADQPDCIEVDAYLTARVNAPGTRANGREGQGVDTKGTGPSIKTNLLERAIQGAGNLVASAGRFLGRVAKGFVAGGTDAAVGLYHVAAHPLRTGAALGQAIRHPVHTAQVAWGGARDLARAMAAGDPDSLGRGLFELGGLLFGVTKLGALDKLTDAARVADKAGDVGRVAARGGTEVVQRAMSRAELAAMRETGLIRGGREGTHYVSDAVNSTATRAQSRLALPVRPEIRVTLEVPAGKFSAPSRVQPLEVAPGRVLPGGGMERTATGLVPARVLRIDDL